MLRFWDVRWFTKGVLAVALVGLAACSENQNPLGVQPPSFALSDPTGNQTNPWTGRSGTAAITAYALFGTSATNLTVTSYREADTLFTTPVGCLDKIQVKVYDTQGRLASTQNFNKLNAGNVATVQVRGAQVGYRLELHVNVSCIDPKRTDVVTADVAVIQANTTDPAVIRLSVPGGTPLVETSLAISAYVKVPRGLAAATGNCALTLTYLSGASSKITLPGVTIAAGDSVLCAFTPTIPAPGGLYQFTVAFENVTPTDLNSSNNSNSAQLVVFLEIPKFSVSTWDLFDDTITVHSVGPFYAEWAAAVSNGSFVGFPDEASALDTVRYRTSTLPLVDTSFVSADTVGNNQHAFIQGLIPAQVKFPLVSLTVSQTTPALSGTGTVAYHSRTWTNVAATPGAGYGSICARLLGMPSGPQPAVTLMVCSDEPYGSNLYGQTRIIYQRDTSAAATGNSQYQVDYRPNSELLFGDCHPLLPWSAANQQCFTNLASQGPSLVPYGSSYTFNIVLQDSTRKYTAVVTVPITGAPLDISYDSGCGFSAFYDNAYGWLRSYECDFSVNRRFRRSGNMATITAVTQ